MISSAARIRILVADINLKEEQSLARILKRNLAECEAFSLQDDPQWCDPCPPEQMVILLTKRVQAQRCHIVVVNRMLLAGQDLAALSRLREALKPSRCVLHMGGRSSTAEIMQALEAGLLISSPIKRSRSPQKPLDWVVKRVVWSRRAKSLTILDDSQPLLTAMARQLGAANQLDVTTDEAQELIEYLFPEASRVVLSTLWPGRHEITPRGRSVLIKVTEINDERRARIPVVLKIAPNDKIVREVERYQRYISGYLTGMRHTYLERYDLRWNIGGIVYSFLGSNSRRDIEDEPLRSLADYYAGLTKTNSKDDVRDLQDIINLQDIIKGVFQDTWGHLYAGRKLLSKSILDQYDDVWGGGLIGGISALAPPDFPPGLPSDFSSLPDPAIWLQRNMARAVESDTAITHGDLHLNNILLDDARHSWLIDFERSGWGPVLQDFVEFQFDALTRPSLMDLPRNGLSLLTDIFVAIAAPQAPRDLVLLPSSSVVRSVGNSTQKIIGVTNELRRLASTLTHYEDYRAYLWGLMLNALYINTLAPLAGRADEAERRRRAWLLASVICGRLETWDDPLAPWPPPDWPTSRQVSDDIALTPSRITVPYLELRVSQDEQILRYVLNDPVTGNPFSMSAGEIKLRRPVREMLQQTFEQLSSLAAQSPRTRTAAETRRAANTLAEIGSNLYDELFPEAFKTRYRSLREKYLDKGLLIVSAEAAIPWEIVKPGEEDPTNGTMIYDDAHLCERFHLTRWVAEEPLPSDLILKEVVVVNPSSKLLAAHSESDFLFALHAARPEFGAAASLDTVEAVLESFSTGSANLYHFVCHGNFDLTDPKESKLKLADGLLSAGQIVFGRRGGLLKARPLVFLNACHSGEIGEGLTRLDGWAHRFIEAGASAFIGTLWEVHHELAAKFAIEFYTRLLGLEKNQAPMPLGQAFHDARMVIKNLDLANPTWLAYVLYGNPNARIANSIP